MSTSRSLPFVLLSESSYDLREAFGERPISIPIEGGAYANLRLQNTSLKLNHSSSMTILMGKQPLSFIPPPSITLYTDDRFEILKLLEYAGVYYRTPNTPAAGLGVNIFKESRKFVLESNHAWVGFDWDFTTSLYKIYSPIFSLISIKFLKTLSPAKRRKYVKLFEAAKPFIHECIMGLAVGYALKQGLKNFDQWESYRPQVRIVTQTWSQRLAVVGTIAMPIVSLLMGRLPGKTISESDIEKSSAFITIHDFLNYTTKLLRRFQDGEYQFDILSAQERDEVMEVLKAGRSFNMKLMGAFREKGWSSPTLVFDDSPVSKMRFLREGVRVVNVVNALAPGKEMNAARALCLLGRRAAAQRMVKIASYTEGPALIDALHKLKNGEAHFSLGRLHLSRVPEGSVFVLHEAKGLLNDMYEKFIMPQREVNALIKKVISCAGGMRKLENAYKDVFAAKKP